jgi:hypothetical protein
MISIDDYIAPVNIRGLVIGEGADNHDAPCDESSQDHPPQPIKVQGTKLMKTKENRPVRVRSQSEISRLQLI